MVRNHSLIKKLIILAWVIITLIMQIVPVFASLSEYVLVADFDDVKQSDWYYKDVMEARKSGLVVGGANNKYAPTEPISYAQYIAVMLRVIEPSIELRDSKGVWYEKYITRAKELGIIDKNEKIDPVKAIPREEMIKYTCKSLGIAPYEGNAVVFQDVKPADAKYINAAYYEYLTEGTKVLGKDKRNFGFGETATRAQLASMALRIQSYKNDPQAYKEKAAADRVRMEQEALDRYSITERDIEYRYVSVEKSRQFIEEVLKNVKVNKDMTVTITVPDILPQGWKWRIGISCYEKSGDAYTVLDTSDIPIGKSITSKLYTDAKNIKEYVIKVEFDNGLPGNDVNSICSRISISKDLIGGTTRIYDKFKHTLISASN